MTTSKRSTEFAWLALAGIPGCLWCGLRHICKDGHLYHEEMPGWWLYADFVWVAFFIAAGVAVWRSGVRRRFIPVGLLLFLVVSRLLLAGGGGGLFFVELPALVYLAIVAVLTISRVRRQVPAGIASQNETVAKGIVSAL